MLLRLVLKNFQLQSDFQKGITKVRSKIFSPKTFMRVQKRFSERAPLTIALIVGWLQSKILYLILLSTLFHMPNIYIITRRNE